jgi:hypothetical protein
MDTTKYKQKSMGIVLKRRDNAQIVKKIYGGVINIILEKQDLDGSIEFLQDELSNLVDGKTSIKELIITKSLRANYKDPSKIAHKVLADRIGARDPGNRPVVNERIPFVYIKTTGTKTTSLQGDRIEHPDYIVQNSLIPDYLHYITNQIMKPVLQLYALCLDQLPGYDKCEEYWDDVEKALLEKPLYQNDIRRKNRINNLKLMMVKELLFDKFINMLTEPKVPKVRKSSKKTIKDVPTDTPKVAKAAKATKASAASAAAVSSKVDDDNDNDIIDDTLPQNLEATIRITKKIKTNKIVSNAFIKNAKNKKIWEETNEDCRDKDNEIISIIKKIIAYNPNNIYCITLNYKNLKDEYNRAYHLYNEFVKKRQIYTEDNIDNIMSKVMNTQDTGRLKDIGNIRKYYEIILLNSKFIFV